MNQEQRDAHMIQLWEGEISSYKAILRGGRADVEGKRIATESIARLERQIKELQS